ncbi:hypothetical protein SANA_11440 [Gottschalkiaceae bacterium SANA]|nr:hypothetical protein SANA_11440 [Gottschalkiaceae bacterium SANA]
MSRSLYSLILSDRVVEAIDREAYLQQSNRSRLIERILAEYAGVETKEAQVREMMEEIAKRLSAQKHIQVLPNRETQSLVYQAPIRFKYNPTLRYRLEWQEIDGDHQAVLKIFSRTTSRSLADALETFFLQMNRWETEYVPFMQGENCLYRNEGKGTIQFVKILYVGSSAYEEVSRLISRYLRLLNTAIEQYFSSDDPVIREKRGREVLSRWGEEIRKEANRWK